MSPRSRRSRPRPSSARPIFPASSTMSSPTTSTDAGFTVRGMEGIEVPFDKVQELSGEQVYAHIKRSFLRHKGADAIYMLGSGWRTLEIVRTLEQDLQVPVVHPVHGAGVGNPEASACARAALRLRPSAGGLALRRCHIGTKASVARIEETARIARDRANPGSEASCVQVSVRATPMWERIAQGDAWARSFPSGVASLRPRYQRHHPDLGITTRGIRTPMTVLIVATMISLGALGMLAACANE